jgi:hypothetical protein
MSEAVAKKDDNQVEITVDDYTFKANIDLLDDVDTLEKLDDVQAGKVGEMIKLIKLVVGEDGYDQMKAHFVAKDGRMRIAKMNSAFEAIFEKFDPKG